MARTKEYREATIIFVFMVLVFFWPLFEGRILSQADTLYFFPPWDSVRPAELAAPSNTVLNDQTREFLTFFKVARESFHRMEFPLWNPYIMAGTPLLANSQSALLFPLNWSFYLLPLSLGFTVGALLKVFIAGYGTYLFARKLNLSHPASILAGTAYSFSIFNVFWLNHPHTNVTIFFPLLLLLAEHIVQDPSRSAMALLGLTVGVQLLGGHVEIAFQIAFAVTLFFLFRVIDAHRKDVRALSLRLRIFVGGYGLGFLLAGILMIPFLEFLFQSATWQVRSGENPFFLKPIGLVSSFLSDFFIRGSGPPDLIGYHGVSLYVGIAPLILAVAGMAIRPGRRSAFFAGLSLFALAIVFGLPPLFSLLTSLPLFKQAPNYYLVIFYVLGVSLLGAAGADAALSAADPGELRRAKKGLVITGLVLPLFVVGVFFLAAKTLSLPHPLKGIEGNAGRAVFLAAFTFACLTVAIRIRRLKGILGILLIAGTFVDLFMAGSGWNPAIPARWTNPPTPPAIQFLDRDRDVYRIAGLEPVIPPNLATLCGLQDVRGYDVPVDGRYHIFFQKALKGKTAWWIYDFPGLETGAMPFLSLLNVKYFVSLEPLPPPFALVYDKEVKIYGNPEAFSRAFLVHRVEPVKDGSEALARVLTLGPRLRQVAVVEGSTGPFSDVSAPGRGEGAGDRVQILAYTGREVEIAVETSSPGLLVLGDAYFPGWKADVDGKRVPIFRTDYLLRGVWVDRGFHRIRFFYRPDSFYIGLGLTILSGAVSLWSLKMGKR